MYRIYLALDLRGLSSVELMTAFYYSYFQKGTKLSLSTVSKWDLKMSVLKHRYLKNKQYIHCYFKRIKARFCVVMRSCGFEWDLLIISNYSVRCRHISARITLSSCGAEMTAQCPSTAVLVSNVAPVLNLKWIKYRGWISLKKTTVEKGTLIF